MNITIPEQRLAHLRRVFDESFAEPAETETEDLLALIAIRLSGEALVLRADQITGIARLRRVTPAPSCIPELIGLAGMRGTLLPVFSLAALLGLARSEECSWVALAHRESPVGLAFDEFEGQIETRPACLYDDASAPARRHVRQLAQFGSAVRAVVDVASVVEAIRLAAESSRSPQ